MASMEVVYGSCGSHSHNCKQRTNFEQSVSRCIWLGVAHTTRNQCNPRNAFKVTPVISGPSQFEYIVTMLVTVMTTTHIKTLQSIQIKTPPPKTYRRSPYREATTVVRVPASLLPTVHQLLDQARQDVEDAAWLEGG
jgi:hypothetical protein